ncbi:MAG: hypothetical protein IT436_06060 [Phycisphaerales bacterium]|nr:hypothetical protein [Phycisphaerales bacterium]
MIESIWLPVLVSLSIFVGALGSVEVGYQFGRRTAPKETDRAHLGAVQGAILGLLGLLLGFSFAGSTQRFLERQQLIVREANAIGTTYLRAELLDGPARDAIRSVLREYTRVRIAAFRPGVTMDQKLDIIARSEALHNDLWRAAKEGVEARPGMAVAVLPGVNEVIDLHTSRLAAGRRHLPMLIVGLLIGCAALSLMTIGFGFGLSRRRHLGLSGTLAIVIACAIWMTLDLDYPRIGLIRLDDSSLEELKFPDVPGPAADSTKNPA